MLHEGGHFVVAKMTGMRVERFFLFFPPKLVSIKRGETEYGIGMIPLGGFVKITGMNPEELEEAEAAAGTDGTPYGDPELAAATDAGRDTPQGLLERVESAGQAPGRARGPQPGRDQAGLLQPAGLEEDRRDRSGARGEHRAGLHPADGHLFEPAGAEGHRRGLGAGGHTCRRRSAARRPPTRRGRRARHGAGPQQDRRPKPSDQRRRRQIRPPHEPDSRPSLCGRAVPELHLADAGERQGGPQRADQDLPDSHLLRPGPPSLSPRHRVQGGGVGDGQPVAEQRPRTWPWTRCGSSPQGRSR